MNALSDSSSILDPKRQFAQHQVVLTLIQLALNDPSVSEFKWLDLACGRGQVIYHITQNLHKDLIKKISYHGFDIKTEYTENVKKVIEGNGISFKSAEFLNDSIDQFDSKFQCQPTFDMISITNTFHEIAPKYYPKIVVESILRLKDNGMLFLYDMEELPENELGAIPWENKEIDDIFNELFNTMGTKYQSNSGRWPHSRYAAWNLLLRKNYLQLSNEDIMKKKDEAIKRAQDTINDILKNKCDSTTDLLEGITKGEVDIISDEDKHYRDTALIDFWSLRRAMENLE